MKFEYGSGRFFRALSLILKKKKEVIEQLYYWAMTNIIQPVTT